MQFCLVAPTDLTPPHSVASCCSFKTRPLPDPALPCPALAVTWGCSQYSNEELNRWSKTFLFHPGIMAMWLLLSVDSKPNSSPTFGFYTKSQLDLEVCYLIQSLYKISNSLQMNGKHYLQSNVEFLGNIAVHFLHVDWTLCHIQHANIDQTAPFVGQYSTEGDVFPLKTQESHTFWRAWLQCSPQDMLRGEKNKPLQPTKNIHWKQADCL